MRVIIRGRPYNITKEDVEEKLKDIEPEEGRAKYFVEIGGKEFPIKQVLTQTLGLSKLAFTSQDAFIVLDKLGFEIVERN